MLHRHSIMQFSTVATFLFLLSSLPTFIFSNSIEEASSFPPFQAPPAPGDFIYLFRVLFIGLFRVLFMSFGERRGKIRFFFPFREDFGKVSIFMSTGAYFCGKQATILNSFLFSWRIRMGTAKPEPELFSGGWRRTSKRTCRHFASLGSRKNLQERPS